MARTARALIGVLLGYVAGAATGAVLIALLSTNTGMLYLPDPRIVVRRGRAMTEAWERLPRSLSGHVLAGDRAVRFIFTDEAGTSGDRDEHVRVVASVVAHADQHVTVAEAAIHEAMMCVPEEFRDGFVFHAEDIMNNRKYRDRWRLTDRAYLLASMMSIPKKMGMPICFGVTHADAPETPLAKAAKLRLNEEQHVISFRTSVALADKWIVDHAHPQEIATLVCESDADIARGYSKQPGILKISRVRRTIHFVSKYEDSMVWIADACAYGFKRFLSGKDFGDMFVESMSSHPIPRGDFIGPSSGYTIWSPRPLF